MSENCLRVSYPTWKSAIGCGASGFYAQRDTDYELYACSELGVFATTVSGEDLTDFETSYKSTCAGAESYSDAQAQALLAKVPCFKVRGSGGQEIVTQAYSTGDKPNFITPNLADPTSWYMSSVRVEGESPIPDVGRTVWALSHANAIDVTHGKLAFEDNLYAYRFVVRVDDVEVAEVDAHTAEGDYTVDYAAGEITFETAIGQESTVEVDYSYANGSKWWIEAGTGIMLRSVKAQFSADAELQDSVVFQVTVPNPYNPEERFVVRRDVYKTRKEIVAEANTAYMASGAQQGGNWRDMDQDLNIVFWDFQTMTPLNAVEGMRLEVLLDHDVPCTGAYVTVTFYTMRVE